MPLDDWLNPFIFLGNANVNHVEGPCQSIGHYLNFNFFKKKKGLGWKLFNITLKHIFGDCWYADI